MERLSIAPALLFILIIAGCTPEPSSVLVFSKTEGYRHASIEPGIEALKSLGEKEGFNTTATEDASLFTDEYLSQFSTIVFLCTTGDVLDPTQQEALQRYVQAGGGFVGIHSASDTEYDWPWYGQLVGGYFTSHPGNPNVREGKLLVVDETHPSTAHLPKEWIRSDEWYEFRDMYSGIEVLLDIDETSYKRPEENAAAEPRPIAWHHAFDGGRMFYTALGHTSESWTEPAFLDHIWGGMQYTIESGRNLNYAATSVRPESARFRKTVLDQNLNEPMELEFLDDDRIIFVERPGGIKIHTLSTGETSLVATLDVSYFGEEGLMGVGVDPHYADNNWIYLVYSDANREETVLSRFVLDGMKFDRSTEKRLLTFPVDRDKACCHMGGSIEFDQDGNLYLSVGDNTNPFESDSFNPIDERTGRYHFDAQRSAGNSMDLRGKILRITPKADGSYTIPDGNLFTDPAEGRPEIFVMGNRNPFRISIDRHTGYLYWGEVGPDAQNDGDNRGPRGYDEINQARSPGFFGWPYLIADNKSYFDYNFSRQRSGSLFQSAAVVNDSPNNTGLKELPPAQPALIWYPYGKSDEFPNLGVGGRTAMAGPVFYANDFPATDVSFPPYYSGRLFIYEWIRGWIATVVLNENADLVRVDRFLEASLDLSNPMDMLFGPDGSMYVLEYGKGWNSRNLDARLSNITYNGGNRRPVAMATASKTVGAAPLSVNFSTEGTVDKDGDRLKFAWDFDSDGEVDSRDTT
ncbi:MAG: cytochrome C, partial [Rhodothermales bacterium]|nr:cytochrome C [Rhodothermales bacterium]